MASRYGVFNSAVLMRHAPVAAKGEAFIFEPAPSQDLQRTGEAPGWRVEVRFPEGQEGQGKLLVKDRPAIPTPTQSRVESRISSAVLAAFKCLAERGKLTLPCVIETSQTTDAYFISFVRLPSTPGGATVAVISKDMRHCHLLHGR